MQTKPHTQLGQLERPVGEGAKHPKFNRAQECLGGAAQNPVASCMIRSWVICCVILPPDGQQFWISAARYDGVYTPSPASTEGMMDKPVCMATGATDARKTSAVPQPSNEFSRLECAELRCALPPIRVLPGPRACRFRPRLPTDNRPSQKPTRSSRAERLLGIRRPTARLLPSSERVLRRQFGSRVESLPLRGLGAEAACRGSREQLPRC